MAQKNVIIELRYSEQCANSAQAAVVASARAAQAASRQAAPAAPATAPAGKDDRSSDTAAAPSLDREAVPELGPLKYDDTYPLVQLPKLSKGNHPEGELYDTTASLAFDAEPRSSTYLARGEVEEAELVALQEAVRKQRGVIQIYADVEIQPTLICPGSPALGTDADVERLLCTAAMHSWKMDGRGVLVAIVDTGINLGYLKSHGKHPTLDTTRSWAWDPASVTPGNAPVGHGTMCAYDVCIAAPHCTVLDIALLHPLIGRLGQTLMNSLLSDAIRAYGHLLGVMMTPRRPGENRSLVVSNSWAMYHPSWDFPVHDPRNYSDHADHPFNRIVATLERAGADILFAAGNCGADCPSGDCGNPPVTTRAIYGANSSPAVTCVAGVDTTLKRVGYSAIGPGRLAN